MTDETLFYVLGIGLTALAVIVSFIGLRWEKFPGSRPIMGAVAGVFALLVVATAVFGWRNAEDEQAHREAARATSAIVVPPDAYLQEGHAYDPARVSSATRESAGSTLAWLSTTFTAYWRANSVATVSFPAAAGCRRWCFCRGRFRRFSPA